MTRGAGNERLVLNHYEDDGEFYFTLKGDCVHYNKNCTGLNIRSYELQSRRLCMIFSEILWGSS